MIGDFGLAFDVSVSKNAPAFGYVTHFAPEIITSSQMSKLTDIYAMGVTLFRLLNQIQDWTKVVKQDPNHQKKIQRGTLVKSIGCRSFVPDRLCRIVNKATNPTPARRYRSTTEFRQALERLKPVERWTMDSPQRWTGREIATRKRLELYYDAKRHSVLLKKAGRLVHGGRNDVEDEATAIHLMSRTVASRSFRN